MDIIKLNGLSYASNTYVLISEGDAAVVDPSADIKDIKSAIGEAKLRYILLTHCHFDHILKLDSLRAETRAEVCIHKADADMMKDPALNGSEFFGLDFASLGADRILDNGELIPLGKETIEVISTPGHTPGSVCYDCGNDLICGDTLFTSGYGRYDLPGGDGNILFASLKMLADRRDNPMIHPGHGASCALSDADVIRAIRYTNF
ncbi:MAG: MBL fold metallo-hydrolase [Clostridia bacterium]|nr:MBL fold metallo-hydrolase [Clostridia bacterium]